MYAEVESARPRESWLVKNDIKSLGLASVDALDHHALRKIAGVCADPGFAISSGILHSMTSCNMVCAWAHACVWTPAGNELTRHGDLYEEYTRERELNDNNYFERGKRAVYISTEHKIPNLIKNIRII